MKRITSVFRDARAEPRQAGAIVFPAIEKSIKEIPKACRAQLAWGDPEDRAPAFADMPLEGVAAVAVVVVVFTGRAGCDSFCYVVIAGLELE